MSTNCSFDKKPNHLVTECSFGHRMGGLMAKCTFGNKPGNLVTECSSDDTRMVGWQNVCLVTEWSFGHTMWNWSEPDHLITKWHTSNCTVNKPKLGKPSKPCTRWGQQLLWHGVELAMGTVCQNIFWYYVKSNKCV